MDVADWLGSLGLERYEAAFRDNDVDAQMLPSLTADDLKEIGITSLGHRRRLLEAIAALRVESTPAGDPVRFSSAPPTGPTRSLAEAAGERRQLTVMFCDLVGSTALSEKLDPEELRSLLHAYRTLCGDVIARYDGFVARYVGDGILTYFGWPTAHEEDAERAVRAALEIVHTVKRASSTEDLSVRIGIATGPVVVGEPAGVGDQSKLAVGSTPNLAARLQGLATADQIVIAASTRRLVGNAFELTDLGEHDLKGIAEPVHVWRVERALVTESRFDASRGGGALTPLVGREEELDLLLRRWSQAKDGEGQVVLLSGEPGIGKSRILSALRERLEAQGVQALRFQCSPYYVNSAFWPIIDNFERTLKFTRDETTDAKLDKLEALIVTQYGRPLADVRFVAAILSIPCEQRYGALPMTPQKHKDETLRTLVDITEAAARQQPSVMLFEDAHWADPTTLEVLDLLIDRVKTVPLLVVLTHRPEFQSRWSRAGPCRRTEPVQAHPDAECGDGLRARGRQGATRGAARADPDPDRRRAAVCRRADQVHSRIGRAEGGGRSLRVWRLRSRRHHSGHAAGLADGAAGSVHAGEGDRPDRGSDWPRVQLRADRRGRADAAGPTR